MSNEPALNGMALTDQDRSEPLLRPGNSNCGGCGMSNLMQMLRRAAAQRDVKLVIPACCAAVTGGSFPESAYSVPTIMATFASAAAVATGVASVAQLNGEETRVVCLAGDGGMASSILHASNPNGDIQGTINARGFTGGNNSGAGDGGEGGSVHVEGTLSAPGNVTIFSTATPGPGGSTSGSGTAGDGGVVTVGPLFGNSTGGGAVSVNLNIGDINAGAGGRATTTGAAGNGTSLSITDAVDGSTTGVLQLSQSLFAGRAGIADSGVLGTAGTAYSSLSKSGSFSDLRVESIARGGAGSQPGAGFASGDGGMATAIGNATNDAGFVGLNVSAVGGAGGSIGLGGGNGGNALAQGTATGTTSTSASRPRARTTRRPFPCRFSTRPRNSA